MTVLAERRSLQKMEVKREEGRMAKVILKRGGRRRKRRGMRQRGILILELLEFTVEDRCYETLPC